jgi:hypothetical protein
MVASWRTPPTPAPASQAASSSSLVARVSPTRIQPGPWRSIRRAEMRASTRRAATLIFRAEDKLVEAGAVIANGYLRLDHQGWIRVVETRRIAEPLVSAWVRCRSHSSQTRPNDRARPPETAGRSVGAGRT